MLWPFLLENDDGLSLAGQYVGRDHNQHHHYPNGTTVPVMVTLYCIYFAYLLTAVRVSHRQSSY